MSNQSGNTDHDSVVHDVEIDGYSWWYRMFYLFIMSYIVAVGALWVSLAMLVVSALIQPFSVLRARIIKRWLGETYFTLAPYLLQSWNKIDVKVLVKGSIKRDGSYLMLSNHIGSLDWMFGLATAHVLGPPFPGSVKAVVKKSLMYVPLFGWMFWALEFAFVERNWAKDEKNLSEYGKKISDYPAPFWVAIWVEGSRQTAAKLRQSQEFCRQKGLPELQNLLFPRFKAFKALSESLRDKIDGVVNSTVIIDVEKPTSLGSVLSANTKGSIYILLEEHKFDEIADAETWLTGIWIQKDKLLSRYKVDKNAVLQEFTELPAHPQTSFAKVYTLSSVVVLTTVLALIWMYYDPTVLLVLSSLFAVLVIGFCIVFVTSIRMPQSRKKVD